MVNAVFVGVTLLVIMGLALFFHVIVKVTPEEGWASAIMVILALVYITGLFGNTTIALFIIYLVAIIGIIMSVVAWIRKDKNSFKTFFSPGIVMIFCLAGVGVIAFHGMHICNWDELYQWGKAANYMVEFDKLPNGSDFSGESLLLSSTTFFHYFFSKISTFFMKDITESNYYVSNLLLWFSALLLPLSGDGWKDWKRVWSFGLFQFLFTAIVFVQPYYNIYTDQPTAYWAGGLIAWLLLGKCSKRNVYLIPLVLLNVGMMKSMVGPMFSGIVIVAVLVLYCTFCHTRKKSILPKEWKHYLFSKRGFFGLLAVLSPFVFIGIWSVVTGKNGIYRGNGMTMEEGRVSLTIKAMVGKLFDSVNLHEETLYLSYISFFLIVVGFVVVLYPVMLDKEEELKYRNLMYVYLVGFAGFFFVMVFAYLKIFGYTESTQALSLERYFSDYMMLGIVPLSIPLFKRSKKEKLQKINLLKKGIILIAVICMVYGSSDYFLENFAHTYAMEKENYAEREKFVSYAKAVKGYTNETGKIYFINQKKTGLFTLVADYELGEQLSRGGMCFNFRKDTSTPVAGLTEYDISLFPSVLAEQGYEYVWVYTTNNYFNENMKELFGLKKVKDGNFYKVVRDDSGVKLEYMGKVQGK